MRTNSLFNIFQLFLFLFISSALKAQPPISSAHGWTGLGDGHSWTDPFNWSKVYCLQNGIYNLVYATPADGEIIQFSNTGNISITNCPYIILGNVAYNSGGYNHCAGGSISTTLNLYSLQIEPFSYVTLDNTILAGGIIGESGTTSINTALEIDQGRLTCPGISGVDKNYPALHMNSIKATNSIIEITNPGTGGGFNSSGNSYFNNCTITCTSFGSSSRYNTEKDEFYGCTINSPNIYFYGSTNAKFQGCTFNLNGSNSIFSFGSSSPQNNSVTLDNVKINAGASVSSFVLVYNQNNYIINGDITCFNTSSSFKCRILDGKQNCVGPGGTSPCYNDPIPLKLNGNLILQGGSLMIQDGTLDITGNLEMNGIVDPTFTRDVKVNGQKVFEIGGSNNYVNYDYGYYGPIPGGSRFGLKFSGSSDSHIKWPTGFPVDTLTIEKTGCAKVYLDNSPLHVTGKLQVNSGQLVLQSNPASNYSLLNGGDIILENGGSIAIAANTDIAIAGSFLDKNTINDPASCYGFNNLSTNNVFFYNNIYSPATRLIGSLSSSSIGNVKFINQNSTPFTLQNNLVTSNFDFGTNGKIILGDYDFLVKGIITNNNNSKYFVTNGYGSLQLNNISGQQVLFPIGISESSYTPVSISNNGISDNFKARVKNGLLDNGTSGNPITTEGVNRTWIIEESDPGESNATITLQWNASDELPGFVRNNVYLNHYIFGAWDSGIPGISNGGGPFTFSRSGITSFSPFTITSSTSVLPLKLISFFANKLNSKIQLNWQTTSENDLSHFDIERSIDGIEFSKISEVGTVFNNYLMKNYFYKDNNPINGTNYYRLKMVDKDGKFTYSKIVAIKMDVNKNAFKIYPNPANEILYVQISGDNDFATLQVFDVGGRKLKEAKVVLNSSTPYSLNIKDLPKGIYNLVLKSKTVNKFQEFVKQ